MEQEGRYHQHNIRSQQNDGQHDNQYQEKTLEQLIQINMGDSTPPCRTPFDTPKESDTQEFQIKHLTSPEYWTECYDFLFAGIQKAAVDLDLMM